MFIYKLFYISRHFLKFSTTVSSKGLNLSYFSTKYYLAEELKANNKFIPLDEMVVLNLKKKFLDILKKLLSLWLFKV